MKRTRRIGKAAALASSLALLSVYVYDQAGGNLLFSRTPATQVLPGSKSKQMMLAPDPAFVSMPGPKSAPVFAAEREPAVVATSEEAPAALSVTEDQHRYLQPQASAGFPHLPMAKPKLLPGSKAAIIFDPHQAHSSAAGGTGEARCRTPINRGIRRSFRRSEMIR